MTILLALGNSADTGGPTAYANNLRQQFEMRGHRVFFVTYGPLLWMLPSGVRHLFYTVKLIPYMLRSDVALGFDTMTVGLPLMFASSISRTPYMVRIGGDFVWEQYVERTGDLVKLSRFYTDAKDKLSAKARLEIRLTRAVVRHAALLLFNVAWLRDIWQKEYGFDVRKAVELENVYPPRREPEEPKGRVFVSAGRAIKLKQEELLRSVIDELKKEYPDIELDTRSLPPAEHKERVARAYAVVLPSVSDTSPNAIIDAVAAGKPFICTDDTGIRARLGGVGIFIDTRDRMALKQAIRALLDPVHYESWSRMVRGFNYVRTWDDIAEEALGHIENVCAS